MNKRKSAAIWTPPEWSPERSPEWSPEWSPQVVALGRPSLGRPSLGRTKLSKNPLRSAKATLSYGNDEWFLPWATIFVLRGRGTKIVTKILTAPPNEK